MVYSTAQALAATLAGTVTHLVSWRLLFGAYALLTLVITGAMGRSRPARRRARRVYGAVFSEGLFLLGGSTYLGVLAATRYGWNDLQVGLLLAAYGLGSLGGGLGLGWVASRLRERAMASGGGVLLAAGFGLVAIDLPWPVFAVGLAAMGLGLAWLHSTLQMRATELVPAARGKAFSLFPFGFFLGGAVGTAAVGRLVDAGLMAPAMALCGLGLGVVGRVAARRG